MKSERNLSFFFFNALHTVPTLDPFIWVYLKKLQNCIPTERQAPSTTRVQKKNATTPFYPTPPTAWWGLIVLSAPGSSSIQNPISIFSDTTPNKDDDGDGTDVWRVLMALMGDVSPAEIFCLFITYFY